MKEIASRDIKKVPALRGKTLVNLFYEPSTRTRTSFEIAGKWLSADVVNITAQASSVVKGESLKDTGMTLQAMGPDIVVIRHPHPGAPHFLARLLKASIINAGDGAHEHPTQALLDLFTIREKKGRLEGLKVAIVGDITHSRVARSNIHGMRKAGMEVKVIGPATLLPPGIDRLGVEVSTNLDRAIVDVDVIMMLRLQLERQSAGLLPLAAGELRLDGAGPDAILPELCHYVGHANAVKTSLSIKENLAFWADYLEDAGSLKAALASFGLSELADFPAGLLSAGQKRRLALSRLFAAPRPIWLLDEPQSSLDQASIKLLDAAIEDHLGQGGIALVASHGPSNTKFAHQLKLGGKRAK